MNKNKQSQIFVNLFFEMKESEKNTFSRISNKMLQINYLTKKKKNDYNDYRFILAFKELFAAFFALIDFDLNIERNEEVIYIKNTSTFNNLKLKKDETVLLLVLRLLFEEKNKIINLNDNIEIDLQEINEFLVKIGFTEKKKIFKERMFNILRLFRSYNIVDYTNQQLEDEMRMKIYPTILFVINFNNLQEINERLKQYVQEGELDENA